MPVALTARRFSNSLRRYNGETYDSRLEQPGWSTPGYDAVGAGFAPWAPAAAVPAGPLGQMVPWAAPPVAVTQTLVPVSVTPHAGPVVNNTCGVDPEGVSVQMSCGGDGNTISAVTFASYGTPTGSCAAGDLAHNAHCDADIGAVVTALCAGKQSCSIECDQASCGGQPLPKGDPCFQTAKSLAVAVSCKSPPPPPPASK